MNHLNTLQSSEQQVIAAIDVATAALNNIGGTALADALARYEEAVRAARARLASVLPAMLRQVEGLATFADDTTAGILAAFAGDVSREREKEPAHEVNGHMPVNRVEAHLPVPALGANERAPDHPDEQEKAALQSDNEHAAWMNEGGADAAGHPEEEPGESMDLRALIDSANNLPVEQPQSPKKGRKRKEKP